MNSLAGIESSEFSSPVTKQSSWQTLDLQVGIEADKWSGALFVDNVTDETAELFFNNRFAQQRLSINKPRTFGFRLRYRIND